MTTNSKINGGVQLTWANVITTLVFGVTLLTLMAGGGWTLFSTQLAALEARGVALQSSNMRSIEIQAAESQRRDNELRDQIATFKQEVARQHQNILMIPEFRQFQQSMNDRWSSQADINKNAIDAYLSSKAFQAWKDERDKRVSLLEERINDLLKRIQPKS